MAQTLTCSCGKRFAVEKETARRGEVPCPACGKKLRFKNRKEADAPRPFAVRKIEADAPPVPRAAGAQSLPVAEEDQPSSAEEAVAVYMAGKKPAGMARVAGSRAVFIAGLLLLILGGTLSVWGSVLMVQGYLAAASLTALRGGGGLSPGGLLQPVADYSRALNELLQEPHRRSRPPVGKTPVSSPGKTPSAPSGKHNGGNEGGGPSLAEQLQTQQQRQEEGQSLLLRGVVMNGLGKLFVFLGGIFLLAALIARLLRPVAGSVSSERAVSSERD